jgi:hypothetical protein
MSTRAIEEPIVQFAEAIGCKNATFINPPEFVSLAISRRKLVRSDEPGSTVRGLFEPATGNRYLIDALRLRDRSLT